MVENILSEKRVRFNITLPPEMESSIEGVAKKKRKSKANVIRTMLADALDVIDYVDRKYGTAVADKMTPRQSGIL